MHAIQQIYTKQAFTYSSVGPRTAEDDKPLEKKPAVKEAPKVVEKPKKEEAEDDWIPPQDSIRFPDPKENTQATEEILNKHLERTGGN